MRTPIDERNTSTRILDAAERLVQERGFNGFSYADIADELGVSKAALHYHFAGKAELGETLILRYSSRFAEALRQISASDLDALGCIHAYADLYLDVLRRERMCLCGMLAAEFRTLPSPMQLAVTRFFDDNERWLVRVLQSGRSSAQLSFAAEPRDAARSIIATLEGAMLVARAYRQDGADRFQAAVALLLGVVTAESVR